VRLATKDAMQQGVGMRAGTLFCEFTDGKGRSVRVRTPRWEDLDDLLDLINSAVGEGVDIYIDEPQERNEEAKWLGQVLAEIESGQLIHVVVEADEGVVGSASLRRRRRCMSHVGELGILLKSGYREAGIGTMLLQTLVGEARKAGLEVLIIKYFAGNDRAQHVYEKVGFRETGREPGVVKRKGRYRDLVSMAMKLS
jgi:L-amino acid N-acyltransferase YncA